MRGVAPRKPIIRARGRGGVERVAVRVKEAEGVAKVWGAMTRRGRRKRGLGGGVD